MIDDPASVPFVLPVGTTPLDVAGALAHAVRAFDRADLFYGHGTGSAQDEACWLVLEAIGLSPLSPPPLQRVLTASERERIEVLLARRISERRPAAYLTGRTWFAGIELRSDERALVPRSPLAEWIVEDFYGLLPAAGCHRILDLCTGGGAIAIACALALPDARVDASDVSPEALSLAAENVGMLGLSGRLRLLQGSLYEPVQGRYDLIVSNPPYVDADDFAAMPAEFRHEPALGLVAGSDGLALVHEILANAADHLGEAGVLVVEVGNSAPALERCYPDLPFLWLEFSAGGSGVFALTRSELDTYAAEIRSGSA